MPFKTAFFSSRDGQIRGPSLHRRIIRFDPARVLLRESPSRFQKRRFFFNDEFLMATELETFAYIYIYIFCAFLSQRTRNTCFFSNGGFSKHAFLILCRLELSTAGPAGLSQESEGRVRGRESNFI